MRAFESLKICSLIGSVCPKQYLDEKVQKSCLMTLKSDAKFEEKLAVDSKNDIRNLVDFNASSCKSGNLHFDVLLLPIAYKVSA